MGKTYVACYTSQILVGAVSFKVPLVWGAFTFTIRNKTASLQLFICSDLHGKNLHRNPLGTPLVTVGVPALSGRLSDTPLESLL